MRVEVVVLVVGLAIGCCSGCGGRQMRGRPCSYSDYAPGTVVVITNQRRLYYVTGGGKAIVYPVGVGRAGRSWPGTTFISSKRMRPDWAPPPEIRRDRPGIADGDSRRLARQSDGRGRAHARRRRICDPRHQRAGLDRRLRLVWLHPHAQFRHPGSDGPRAYRHPGGGHAMTIRVRMVCDRCDSSSARTISFSRRGVRPSLDLSSHAFASLKKIEGSGAPSKRRGTDCESVRWRVLRCRLSLQRQGATPMRRGLRLTALHCGVLSESWHRSRLDAGRTWARLSASCSHQSRRHFGQRSSGGLRNRVSEGLSPWGVTPRSPGACGCEPHAQAPLPPHARQRPAGHPSRGGISGIYAL